VSASHEHTPRIASRDDAVAADASDELRSFRDQFPLPSGVIYLDGNSLGPLSDATLAAQRELESDWTASLVEGWERWVDVPLQVGDRLGETLLGAGAGQVIVADSTTINLFKTIAAGLALRPGRSRVLVEAGGFPTDRYIVRQLAGDVREVDVASVIGALDDTVALAVLSAVDYRTAELAPIEQITSAAHAAGALVLWDLSHAAGALPLRLDDWGVDLAVGCTYKYLNAGPGSPAYLYVRRDHQAAAAQPIPGWFGHVDQFAMEPRYRPAPGIRRFLTGTPNIAGTMAVRAGVEVLAAAGVDRLRRKSVGLTALAIERADTELAPLGLTVATPRDPARRGSHVAVCHPRASELCALLSRDHRVITDHRPPDVLRLGFAPLYTRYVDVWDAFDAIRSVAETLG
jgi:kynureninase